MVKVIAPFKDKTDGNKLYKVGDNYEHKDPERMQMLMDKGFLEKPAQSESKKKHKLFSK